jgi:hypothetical protein
LDVNIATWKGAIEHAEQLVFMAERKLDRERNANERRILKLEVPKPYP